MALSRRALAERYEDQSRRYARAQEALLRALRQAVDDLGHDYQLRAVPIIDGRVKEVESFVRKAKRFESERRVSSVAECFTEIRDIVRGRIVCQTLEDCERVQRLLDDNPTLIVDSIGPVEEHQPSATGYRATHLEARVNTVVDGRERPVLCEVQIMTALQFAWSLYTHKDVYKGKDVPPLVADLMRELSDLLNVADRLADRLIREFERPPRSARPLRQGRRKAPVGPARERRRTPSAASPG